MSIHATDNQRVRLRPATARLVYRLLVPLLDSGLVTVAELKAIRISLSALSKTDNFSSLVAPRFIRPQEAAEMLSISYSQFRTLEREGAFPFKRRVIGGKTVRYLNVEVLDYMMVKSLIEGGTAPEKTSVSFLLPPQSLLEKM